MTELKTRPNNASVEEFINKVDDVQKREDSKKLLKIFSKATGEQPMMWGTAIVGFGKYHYKYASGREADWMLVGFSPRKESLSLYLTTGFELNPDLLQKLGKHKIRKACLYIKKLSDIDIGVLETLIKTSYNQMKVNNQ